MKNKKKMREVLSRYKVYIEWVSDKLDPECVRNLKAYGHEIEQYIGNKNPVIQKVII